MSSHFYEIKCSYRNGVIQLCLALCITSDNIDYDAWIMPYQQHRCSPGAYLHSKSKWKKEIFNNFWVPFTFLCIFCCIVKIVKKVSKHNFIKYYYFVDWVFDGLNLQKFDIWKCIIALVQILNLGSHMLPD